MGITASPIPKWGCRSLLHWWAYSFVRCSGANQPCYRSDDVCKFLQAEIFHKVAEKMRASTNEHDIVPHKPLEHSGTYAACCMHQSPRPPAKSIYSWRFTTWWFWSPKRTWKSQQKKVNPFSWGIFQKQILNQPSAGILHEVRIRKGCSLNLMPSTHHHFRLKLGELKHQWLG